MSESELIEIAENTVDGLDIPVDGLERPAEADVLIQTPAVGVEAPSDGDDDEEETFSAAAGGGSDGLMGLIKFANKITDQTQRDMALLGALRSCRKELEAAEKESEEAAKWLEEAKEVFEFANQLLVGGLTLQEALYDDNHNLSNYKLGKRLSYEIKPPGKRAKIEATCEDSETDERDPHVYVPTNPVEMPRSHVAGCDMTPELVEAHKNNFYMNLIGLPASEIGSFVPSTQGANLKNKAQLAEAVHIVRHWNTGADGLDTTSFRSKHKTWYTRMKPNSEKLGRRTGMHLRTLMPTKGKKEEEVVLCRYSKDGINSVIYVDLEQLFDAIFEVHVLETDHCGRDACKKRVDERYANIPESQVKIFIDTCPLCSTRRDKSPNDME